MAALALMAIASTAQGQARGGFDSKGRLTMHGTPRFVLGVYDSGGGYSTSTATWEQQIFSPGGARGLQGFPLNVYLNYWLGNMPIAPTNALLDVLHNHGMMYLQTGNCFDDGGWERYGPGSFSIMNQSYVQQFAQHPAALGYYIMDECTDPLIPETTAHNQQLHDWDPQGVTFAAHLAAGYMNPALWVNAADVLASDPYPLYGPEPAAGYTHFIVADFTSKMRAVAKPNRPIWSVHQFFKFTSNSRMPTPDELRAHAVMAIVEGAQGILWWDIGVNGLRRLDAGTVATYMDHLKTLTTELAGLEPALLADAAPGALVGNSTKFADPVAGRISQLQHNIAVEWLYSRKQWYQEELAALQGGNTSKSGGMLNGAANVRTLAKIVDGVGYVFAYNYTNATQTPTFTWHTSPTSVRENRTGQTYPVSGASWNDTLGPYQSRVYVINGAGTAPTSPPPPSGGTLGLSFTNPAAGATVSGSTTVTLSPSGGSGHSFTVKVGSATVYAGTNPSFSWNTTTVANGSQTLAATATDSSGASASASRTVNVSNTTGGTPPPPPPSGGASFSVSFSYPNAGAVVSGTQTVGLSTTAAWGQSKTFTLAVDGTVITSQSTTGTTLWYSWDTKNATNGTRKLTATVTLGGQTATATRDVSVANNGPAITLSVGQKVNDSSMLSLTVANSGPLVDVDIYLGVVLPSAAGPSFGCPGGDAVAFVGEDVTNLVVRCLSASTATFPRAASGTTIPGDLPLTSLANFFGLNWPAGPGGHYSVFMAMTKQGSLADGTAHPGDVLALDFKTIDVAP
jgi:hypothetical protein